MTCQYTSDLNHSILRWTLLDLIDGTSSIGTPALLGFIGGRCASVWTSVTREERRKALLECLSRYFGGPKVSAHLVDYAEKDWNIEPYSGGCPCHNATTGSMKDFVDGLRKPFGHLHFAGTETASQWMGYMDGAIDAGRRAASEVLVSLRSEDQPKDDEVDPFTFESQSNAGEDETHERNLWYFRSKVSVFSRAALEALLRHPDHHRHSGGIIKISLSDNISVIDCVLISKKINLFEGDLYKCFFFFFFFQKRKKMTSLLMRQLAFLRPTTHIQPSIRTKMARRITRNRIPTHAKPNDKWSQNKTV